MNHHYKTLSLSHKSILSFISVNIFIFLGVDYGGHYAEVYSEHERPSSNWDEDVDEKGYLKPRKGL